MDTQKGPETIHFKIDKKQYSITANQNPVTGSYLRGLPPIPENYDLFLRSRGHDDDVLIAPEGTYIVKPGEDFYSTPRVINPGEI